MAELTFEEAINKENYTFKYRVLQQMSPRERMAWVKQHYVSIQKHILSRFQFLLDSDPSIITNAARFPYLKEAQAAALSMGRTEYKNLPFVHLFAFFGLGHESGSCHDVLFGEAKPVVLRGQTLAVLDMFASAPADLQYQVISELNACPLNANNPVYISYYRYDDLAKEKGRQVNQWITDCFTYADFFFQVVAFKEDIMNPHEEPRSFKDVAIGPSSLWWLSLVICPALDISADYFYRMDYSNIAVRPGKEMTVLEKLFLGFYLSATRDAQRNCRYLLASSMMKAKKE